MALQKRLAQVSLGPQTALGAEATEGIFLFGVTDGAAVAVDIDEGDLDTTWSTRLVEGFERTQVRPGMSYGFVAIRELIGQHLYAALGADTVTGDSAPYTHTIIEGDPLPYFTGFGRQDADYVEVQDMLLDTLELSWELTSALKGKATWKGTDVAEVADPWTTSGAAQRVQSGYFNMAGGTFTIDGTSALITKGQITINNNLKPVAAAFEVEPVDNMPGVLTIEHAYTILIDDLSLWRKIVFGGADAITGVVAIPYYAAVVAEFLSGGTDTLTMHAPDLKVMVNWPAADVAGGPLELEVAGKTAIDLSGNGIEFVLVNSTASYAPA